MPRLSCSDVSYFLVLSWRDGFGLYSVAGVVRCVRHRGGDGAARATSVPVSASMTTTQPRSLRPGKSAKKSSRPAPVCKSAPPRRHSSAPPRRVSLTVSGLRNLQARQPQWTVVVAPADSSYQFPTIFDIQRP